MGTAVKTDGAYAAAVSTTTAAAGTCASLRQHRRQHSRQRRPAQPLAVGRMLASSCMAALLALMVVHWGGTGVTVVVVEAGKSPTRCYNFGYDWKKKKACTCQRYRKGKCDPYAVWQKSGCNVPPPSDPCNYGPVTNQPPSPPPPGPPSPPPPPPARFSTGSLPQTKAVNTEDYSAFNTYSRYETVGLTINPATGAPSWTLSSQDVDWRDYLDDPDSQDVDGNQCGSCWSFATSSAITALYNIRAGRSGSEGVGPAGYVSQQQFLDCAPGSCSGGYPSDALQYAANSSSVPPLEGSYYTYTAVKASCEASSIYNSEGYSGSTFPIELFEQTPYLGTLGLMLAVQYQPVIVDIVAAINSFFYYTGGIFRDPDCYSDIYAIPNHNVLVVGYHYEGPTSANNYFILRNSWGTSWGENGHMRIAMNFSSPVGVCGILINPGLYPVLSAGTDCSSGICGGGECTPSSQPPPPPVESSGPAPAPCPLLPSPAPTSAPPPGISRRRLLQSSEVDDFGSQQSTPQDVGPLDPSSLSAPSPLSAMPTEQLGQNVLDLPTGVERRNPREKQGHGFLRQGAAGRLLDPLAHREQRMVRRGSQGPAAAARVGRLLGEPSGNGPSAPPPPPNSPYTCNCSTSSYLTDGTNRDGNPTCILKVQCSVMVMNPCGVGTCQDDGTGGYTCVCPAQYQLGQRADGATTCVPLAPGTSSLTSYLVQPGDTCYLVYTMFGLTEARFKQQNPGIDCSSDLTTGTSVNVVPASTYRGCRARYPVSVADAASGSCASIRAKFPGVNLATLNPGLDCTRLLAGQQICILAGTTTDSVTGYNTTQLCTSYVPVRVGDTCASLIQRNRLSYTTFYTLNSGFQCDNINALVGQQVCVAGVPLSTVRCIPPLKTYTVGRYDTCLSLVVTKFKSQPRFVPQFNSGFICTRFSLFVGLTLCTPWW